MLREYEESYASGGFALMRGHQVYVAVAQGRSVVNAWPFVHVEVATPDHNGLVFFARRADIDEKVPGRRTVKEAVETLLTQARDYFSPVAVFTRKLLGEQ